MLILSPPRLTWLRYRRPSLKRNMAINLSVTYQQSLDYGSNLSALNSKHKIGSVIAVHNYCPQPDFG
jgi:hypothetical protein